MAHGWNSPLYRHLRSSCFFESSLEPPSFSPFPSVSLRLWRQPRSNPATTLTHPFLGVQPCARWKCNLANLLCPNGEEGSRENRRHVIELYRYLNPSELFRSLMIEWIYDALSKIFARNYWKELVLLKEGRNKMNIVGDVLYRRIDFYWCNEKWFDFIFILFFFREGNGGNWLQYNSKIVAINKLIWM